MLLDLFSLITGEGALISGLVLQFYTLLTPTPWFRGDPSYSLLYFSPYYQPQGYAAPNSCSGPLSNSTVDTTIPLNGKRSESVEFNSRITRGIDSAHEVRNELSTRSNADAYSNVVVWMGPYGTCSRDQDMRIFCTKPSYKSPVYNLTYIQPNSVYYSDSMRKAIDGHAVMGLTVTSAVAAFFYLLSSLFYWFPGILKSHTGAFFFFFLCGAFLFLAGWPTWFLNFRVEVNHVSDYNSVDNFYGSAPCDSIRPLKSGVLLKASSGINYKLFWVGWVFIFVIAGITLLLRAANLSNVYDAYHTRRLDRPSPEVRRQQKEAEKEAKKEKKFRHKVEKEKDRIRRIAREEIEMEGNGKDDDSVDPPSYESKEEVPRTNID